MAIASHKSNSPIHERQGLSGLSPPWGMYRRDKPGGSSAHYFCDWQKLVTL